MFLASHDLFLEACILRLQRQSSSFEPNNPSIDPHPYCSEDDIQFLIKRGFWEHLDKTPVQIVIFKINNIFIALRIILY